MKKLISTKNRDFLSWVGQSEMGKSQLIYNWLKIGKFQPKFGKIYFIFNTRKLFTMLCERKLINLKFVQGENFELIYSLKSNGTK